MGARRGAGGRCSSSPKGVARGPSPCASWGIRHAGYVHGAPPAVTRSSRRVSSWMWSESTRAASASHCTSPPRWGGPRRAHLPRRIDEQGGDVEAALLDATGFVPSAVAPDARLEGGRAPIVPEHHLRISRPQRAEEGGSRLVTIVTHAHAAHVGRAVRRPGRCRGRSSLGLIRPLIDGRGVVGLRRTPREVCESTEQRERQGDARQNARVSSLFHGMSVREAGRLGAASSLLSFGPRPLDVRARPAEARSEERAEPTFVGEHAPQDRNEGGRDAAATGRRPLEVPGEGREKINGLL